MFLNWLVAEEDGRVVFSLLFLFKLDLVTTVNGLMGLFRALIGISTA